MAINLTNEYQTFARKDWSFTYGGYTYDIGFYAQAKLKSQSIANSTSTVDLRTIYDVKTAQRTVHFSSAHTWIHDEAKDLGDTYWNTGQHIVQEITRTFQHNESGDPKTQNIGAEWSATFGGNTGVIAGDIVMPRISRYPMIQVAPDFTDEQNPTVTYSTILGFDNATVQITIAQANGTAISNINYRNVSVAAGSYTFELTSAERSALQTYCNNSKTKEVRFILRTTAGNDVYTSYVNKTLTIANANPTQTNTTSEQNSKVSDFLNDATATKVIYNASKIRFVVTPSAKKNATITSVKIIHNNIEYTKTSSPYQFDIDVVNNSFIILVTDSRGNTNGAGGQTITKTGVSYSPVNIADYSFTRVNPTSSNIVVTLTGTHQQSVDSKTNNATIKYKLGSGSWTTISSGISHSGNTITLNATLSNVLVYTSDGQFSLSIEDQLTSDTEADQRGYVTKGIATFERGATDVQVNGDLFVADTNRQNRVNVLTKIASIVSDVSGLDAISIPNVIRLRKYTKSVTINSGMSSVTMGTVSVPTGYTYVGCIADTNGYGDQWVVSYSKYGSNIVAMVHSNYSGSLSSSLVCYAIYIKTSVYNQILL